MSTENTDSALTEEDYRKIEEITKYGIKAFEAEYDPTPDESDDAPVCGSTDTHSGEPCQAPAPGGHPDAKCHRHGPDDYTESWRSTSPDGPVHLSVEQCSAVRAAASDGKTYREIANLFSYLPTPMDAHDHATGSCEHVRDGHPPVESRRHPGPQEGAITAEECESLRERCRDGWFMSWSDAADYVNAASHTTPRRHLLGECGHDVDELERPEFSDDEIRRRRGSAGWSQRGLASRLGVSHSAATGWETGKRSIRFCVAFALDAVLPDGDV